MLQETFEKLRELQEIIAEKFAIEAEIQEIPKTLSTKTDVLQRMKRSFIERNEKYESTRKHLADLRVRLSEAEAAREKYEQQMDLIKTQREYEALDKEIREASDREQNLRREIQREERALEEVQAVLSREESMIQDQEKDLEVEQERIREQQGDKEATLKALLKKEHAITPDLDDDLIFKFERIIRSKEGVGIVPIKKGTCSGCHMMLPNQLVNDVRSGEHIHNCPYCSRILFWFENVEGDILGDDAGGLVDLMENEFDDDTEGHDLLDDSLLDEEELDIMDDGDDTITDEEEDLEDSLIDDDEEDEPLDEDGDDFEDDDVEEDDDDIDEDEEE
ncbi:zinc ribbon domain-containing protein [Spirochaeta africana]|uniref:Zn-ribbon protein, possibly nucleic acid-binding protein n=1 Tax=Spirochaeta africana (strain ATCC 700263 / DSM 8902 / Z-7692) TaxID=889378 RepID=H9UJ68_SPIAZ|nr:C4-type zinc ribbon domain-containing protein [Spirochaeta africana]AFG37561.1 Zn-ribbon protein, possibly nucleic acid-binding protein [Spirochaeta africana DSM 8902]